MMPAKRRIVPTVRKAPQEKDERTAEEKEADAATTSAQYQQMIHEASQRLHQPRPMDRFLSTWGPLATCMPPDQLESYFTGALCLILIYIFFYSWSAQRLNSAAAYSS